MSMATMMFDKAFRKFIHPQITDLNALKLNMDGLLLAGMHSGSLVIWNTLNNDTVLSVALPVSVSTVVWLTSENGHAWGFAAGCTNGQIYVYGRQGHSWDQFKEFCGSAHGAIEELAWDPHNKRLAVAAAGQVRLFHLTEQYEVDHLTTTPRRAAKTHFVSFLNEGHDLLVGYLESHELCSYQIDDPLSLQWSAYLPTRIGHALIAGDNRHLVVYNLSTGIDVYELPILRNSPPIHTFPFANSLRQISLVASVQGGQVLICGGPNGRVNIFDLRNGTRAAATLQLGTATDFIQVVAAKTINDRIVLAAGCPLDNQVTVKVWECPLPEKQAMQLLQAEQSFTSAFFMVLLHILLGILILALLFSGVAAGTALYYVISQKNIERLL